MIYRLIYLSIILLATSCRNQSQKLNIFDRLVEDKAVDSFFKMNDRLIKTISVYESNMNFSDTLIRGELYKLNSSEIFNTYFKSLEFLEININDQTLDSLLFNNQLYLVDSLLVPNIYRNHNQKKELREIKELINFDSRAENISISKANLIVKNEIFFNLVFQFLFRYKIEEEVNPDIVSPFVFKDSLLDNGNRELSIYTVSMVNGDRFKPKVKIDTIEYNQNEILNYYRKSNPIKYIYNPSIAPDSIAIRTFMENRISGRTDEIIKWYKIKK